MPFTGAQADPISLLIQQWKSAEEAYRRHYANDIARRMASPSTSTDAAFEHMMSVLDAALSFPPVSIAGALAFSLMLRDAELLHDDDRMAVGLDTLIQALRSIVGADWR